MDHNSDLDKMRGRANPAHEHYETPEPWTPLAITQGVIGLALATLILGILAAIFSTL